MKTIDIIYTTCDSQPEGRKILNKIKINTSVAVNQFNNCDLLNSIIKVKFDVDKAKNEGYSLQEILDVSDGILKSEFEKFVLSELQKYISSH
jgi:hypothetical protein